MAEQSGFDALLKALKDSGMDVDKESFGTQNGSDGSEPKQQEAAGSAGSTASESKSSPAGDAAKNKGFKATRGGKAAGSGKTASAAGGFGQMFGQMFGMPGAGGKDSDEGGKGPEVPPFMETVGSWGGGKKVVALVVLLVVLAAAYWWFHPPINIQSTETWTGIVVVCVLAFLALRGASLKEGHDKKKAEKAGSPAAATKGSKKGVFKVASFVPLAVLAVGVVGLLLSQSFFPGNAEKYSSILQTQNLNFTQDIQQVNYSEIPVIDRDTAIILGDKKMGTIPEYVSQFEVSSLYSQINYQGSPVRVSPLGYADLFKWFTNREQGIPAYALVNMTTQDTDIVRISSVDGTEGAGIKYSQSEPLARNIDRYVQLKYPFYMFTDKSFEIDENGHPWWICPTLKKTIGLFGGTTIDRVVMCDAVTGECQDLAVEEVPQWVDRVYPSDLLLQQYNWYGAYNNGWINSWLGQQGVVKTTPGNDGSLGYNYLAKDDDVWVYTGVTSATSDSSIIGFVLVNQRTAESHFYSIAGATETSAMESAEGQVQNLRYEATFPILINVSNQPTYFMALKDGAGTVKKFAMLDIKRYQNVAVGDTVAECQKSYVALLATNGVDVSSGTVEGVKEAKGTIAHMAQAVISGNSHFYVKLKGSDAVYDFALPTLVDIVGYEEGDTVSFTYVEGDGTNTVQAFGGLEDLAAQSASDDDAEASADTGDTGEQPGGDAAALEDASAEETAA